MGLSRCSDRVDIRTGHTAHWIRARLRRHLPRVRLRPHPQHSGVWPGCALAAAPDRPVSWVESVLHLTANRGVQNRIARNDPEHREVVMRRYAMSRSLCSPLIATGCSRRFTPWPVGRRSDLRQNVTYSRLLLIAIGIVECAQVLMFIA